MPASSGPTYRCSNRASQPCCPPPTSPLLLQAGASRQLQADLAKPQWGITSHPLDQLPRLPRSRPSGSLDGSPAPCRPSRDPTKGHHTHVFHAAPELAVSSSLRLLGAAPSSAPSSQLSPSWLPLSCDQFDATSYSQTLSSIEGSFLPRTNRYLVIVVSTGAVPLLGKLQCQEES